MTPTPKETAVFAGGCFWCTEAIFNSLKGIISVMPGYAGGSVPDPTYEQVSQGNTGHAEAVRIEFDPTIIPFEDLLAVFFNTHDPTTVNRQGYDVGSQYRSIIFYVSDEQKNKAERLIAELNESQSFENPVVTEVRPFEKFYLSDDYHVKYYENHKGNSYCEIVIEPKLEKLQKRFAALLKS